MSEKEKLLAQSEAVRECAKHMIKKIKEEKKKLLQEKEDKNDFGHFADCGEYYIEQVTKREMRIEVLIEGKISLEKYAKKLKHMAYELE